MKGKAMTGRFILQVVCGAIATAAIANSARAAAITIQPGDSQLPGVVSSIWRNPAGDVVHSLNLPAPGNMTSSELAVATRHNLLSIPGIDPTSVAVAGDLVNV